MKIFQQFPTAQNLAPLPPRSTAKKQFTGVLSFLLPSWFIHSDGRWRIQGRGGRGGGRLSPTDCILAGGRRWYYRIGRWQLPIGCQ